MTVALRRYRRRCWIRAREDRLEAERAQAEARAIMRQQREILRASLASLVEARTGALLVPEVEEHVLQ